MDLTFELSNGSEFIFVGYTKYLQYIDVLEIEPFMKIPIIEEFTKEELEYTNNEYHKFVNFKNIVNKILESKDYDKKELIDNSNFDFDDKVLKFLHLDLSCLEKEYLKFIKNYVEREPDFIYNFEKNPVDDNLLIYLILNGDTPSKINNCIKNKHINSLKWLHPYYFEIEQKRMSEDELSNIGYAEQTMIRWGYDDEIDWIDMFEYGCYCGDVEIAKYLYSTDLYKIKKEYREYCSVCIAIYFNHIDLVKWIVSLNELQEDRDKFIINWRLFNQIIEFASVELCKWFYENNIKPIEEYIDKKKFEILIIKIIIYEDADKIYWAYSINETLFKSIIDTDLFNKIFRKDIEIVKWLYEIGKDNIDLYYEDHKLFREVCEYGSLEVAKWLYSFGGFNKDEIIYPEKNVLIWLNSL